MFSEGSEVALWVYERALNAGIGDYREVWGCGRIQLYNRESKPTVIDEEPYWAGQRAGEARCDSKPSRRDCRASR